MVEGLPPERLLEGWRAARAALSVTGRWPIAVSEATRAFPECSGEELADFAAAVGRSRPWEVFRWHHHEGPAEAHEMTDWPFPDPSYAEAATRELTMPVDWSDLDHWTYERVRTDSRIREQLDEDLELYEGGRDWYTPRVVDLVFLPTEVPWMSAAWLSYWGAMECNPEARVPFGAVLREWHEKWGAELVACWDTMLQFVVSRTPAPGREAWDLERQIMTMAGSLQDPPWMRALALERTDTWFLHDRP